MKAPATAKNGGADVKAKQETADAHHSVPPSRPQVPPKNPRFRRAVERVHRLGPRICGELLLEVGADLHRVERYASLDRYPPSFLHGIGADAWAPSIFGVST